MLIMAGGKGHQRQTNSSFAKQVRRRNKLSAGTNEAGDYFTIAAALPVEEPVAIKTPSSLKKRNTSGSHSTSSHPRKSSDHQRQRSHLSGSQNDLLILSIDQSNHKQVSVRRRGPVQQTCQCDDYRSYSVQLPERGPIGSAGRFRQTQKMGSSLKRRRAENEKCFKCHAAVKVQLKNGKQSQYREPLQPIQTNIQEQKPERTQALKPLYVDVEECSQESLGSPRPRVYMEFEQVQTPLQSYPLNLQEADGTRSNFFESRNTDDPETEEFKLEMSLPKSQKNQFKSGEGYKRTQEDQEVRPRLQTSNDYWSSAGTFVPNSQIRPLFKPKRFARGDAQIQEKLTPCYLEDMPASNDENKRPAGPIQRGKYGALELQMDGTRGFSRHTDNQIDSQNDFPLQQRLGHHLDSSINIQTSTIPASGPQQKSSLHLSLEKCQNQIENIGDGHYCESDRPDIYAQLISPEDGDQNEIDDSPEPVQQRPELQKLQPQQQDHFIFDDFDCDQILQPEPSLRSDPPTFSNFLQRGCPPPSNGNQEFANPSSRFLGPLSASQPDSETPKASLVRDPFATKQRQKINNSTEQQLKFSRSAESESAQKKALRGRNNNQSITGKSQPASRECMLSFNPFQTFHPSDKFRKAQTPKATRLKGNQLQNTASSTLISAPQFKSNGISRNKFFEDTLCNNDARIRQIKTRSSRSLSLTNTQLVLHQSEATTSSHQISKSKKVLASTGGPGLTNGQAARMDFMNDKRQQRHTFQQLNQQLKTKLAKNQRAMQKTKSSIASLKADMDMFARLGSKRTLGLHKPKSLVLRSELGELQADINELDECNGVLKRELKNEADSIAELTGIIRVLKRNLFEERRERERAVQAVARSTKILQNARHLHDVALEDRRKFLFEHRQADDLRCTKKVSSSTTQQSSLMMAAPANVHSYNGFEAFEHARH